MLLEYTHQNLWYVITKMPVNGDDTTNTIFGYSDDKETSVTSFGDDTLMTYNVIVLFFLDFGDDIGIKILVMISQS